MLAFIALIASTTTAGDAQSRISGTIVAGDTRQPVAGAVVAVPALARTVTSDSAGRFDLDGIPGGELFVLVRAIGFRPDTTLLAFGASEVRVQDIVLDRLVTTLDEVVVKEKYAPVRGKLAEFEDRRRYGIGRFIDTTTFETQRGRPVADILQQHAAGLHIVRASSAAYLSTHRTPSRNAVLGGGRCYMDVWLDGIPVYQGGKGMPLWNINSIQPDAIAAMEVYVGAAQIPVRFNSSGAACGVAVIWLR